MSVSISENPYQPILQQLEQNLAVMEQLSIDCSNCGASVVQVPMEGQQSCPFCGNALTAAPVMARVVPVLGMLPVKIDRADAVLAFGKWLKRRRFAPSGMAQEAEAGELRAVGLPFWNFSFDMTADYTGQRVEGEGEKAKKIPVSDKIAQREMNRLAYAGKKLRPAIAAELAFQECAGTVEYQLGAGGFSPETVSVKALDAFQAAKKTADSDLQTEAEKKLGNGELETMVRNYSNFRISQLLVPVWIGCFNYHGKVYQVAVNAKTGKVTGESPMSIIKVLILAAIVVALIAGVVLALR